jgi:hypothetical protein
MTLAQQIAMRRDEPKVEEKAWIVPVDYQISGEVRCVAAQIIHFLA